MLDDCAESRVARLKGLEEKVVEVRVALFEAIKKLL
jgi:hypothetical protein